ncbi:class V chitinase CHIT5-like [Lycium barbarum]|uniref:class V chitinase CHIT5-like n=1 Tax=Lycium barbarum TaxID=112863 RepID=UPI00293E2EA9|nr:class V chitinase CHIT5-like [Lycium barbarum]
MLSIGGDTCSPILRSMTSSRDNRAAFIKSTIDVARFCGFDGLDLNWEFPIESENMHNLALLFEKWCLTIGLKPLRLLGHFSDRCSSIVIHKSSNISTSYGISAWKQNGVPSKQLVFGMPLYGNTRELKDPNYHGIGAPAVGAGPGTQGEMSYDDIVMFNSENNATIGYNNETVSTYSYAGTNWIGYGDTNSITAKIKYAKAEDLGGYFFWALGFSRTGKIPKVLPFQMQSLSCMH